jgi:hypothetical protein
VRASDREREREPLGMGNDNDERHAQEGHGGEWLSALKPPTSPMSHRAPSRGGRGLHVDVSRMSQSAGALDSTHPPLYSPLASPFAPDLATLEVGRFPLFSPPPPPFLNVVGFRFWVWDNWKSAWCAFRIL